MNAENGESDMLLNNTIGFIGAGNMAEALMRGLLNAGLSKSEQLICSDIRAERCDELKKLLGVQTSRDNLEVIRKADIILYAVKPQTMDAVLKETVGALDASKVVISIVAGVSLSSIAALSKRSLRLLRAMPNVCVSVQEGATAIAAGAHARDEDMQLAITIFNAVGRCLQVAGEHLLDAVTGLSASGPAYVFLMIEALADGGVRMGLGRKESLLLAAQTLLGAAKMHLETDTHPGRLKDMVTSPGGTTIAGLHALEKAGLRGTLMDAVAAATIRATELGKVK